MEDKTCGTEVKPSTKTNQEEEERRRRKERRKYSQRKCCIALALFTVLSLSILIAGVVLLSIGMQGQNEEEPQQQQQQEQQEQEQQPPKPNHIKDMKEYCEPSAEALRVGLHPFLEKCQKLYFKLYPEGPPEGETDAGLP